VNSDAAPVLGIEAIDDLTVQMKLARPDALVLQFMSWYLSGLWIDPKEAANGGFDPAQEVRGNGAWILEDYQPAIGFKFKRNPDWYGGPDNPYIERIDMPIIEDAAQAEAQFRAGNIHWGGVSGPNIPIVAQEVAGTEVFTLPAGFAGSTFGMNRIPESGFNDIRVRQALSMSLDRDTFIEVINDPSAFEDVGITLDRFWNSPLSAGYGAFWLDPKGSDFGPGAENLKHNVAEAKKLLAAADYDDSNQFEFDLIFPGTRYGRDWPTRAETWQSMARDAGIKVNLVVLDYTTEWIPAPPEGVFRTFSNFEGPNSKSAVTYRPNGGRSTPGEWFNTFHQSTGANNEVGDNWPELDALITTARGIFDFEERVQAVHDIQRFMMENVTTIPVLPTVNGVSIKWAGLHGPDTHFAWGSERNSRRETYPWFWLDDTLQA
jgi:peptide/nickel transport system substrate-binding protein